MGEKYYPKLVHPEVEFKDKSSSTAQSVIEPCLKKAGYKSCLRTSFFLDLFLYRKHRVSNMAQSVIDIISIISGIPVFIFLWNVLNNK